jgi:co-chaperonin GroES (HSP10)
MACKKNCETKVSVNFEVKEVKGCKPVGSQVLLELLTTQEKMNTNLYLNNNKSSNEYQAFVKDLGPNLNPENWGFKIGDRVILSGSGVPVPNYDDSERDRVLMEPHCIKGVLT